MISPFKGPGGFPRAISEKELLEMEPGRFFDDFEFVLNRFLIDVYMIFGGRPSASKIAKKC